MKLSQLLSNRQFGIVLCIAGGLLVLAAVLADVINIGAMPGVFGWKQIAGTIAGSLVFIFGLLIIFRNQD